MNEDVFLKQMINVTSLVLVGDSQLSYFLGRSGTTKEQTEYVTTFQKIKNKKFLTQIQLTNHRIPAAAADV